MTCHWTSSTTPRVVDRRHVADLGSDPVHVKVCEGCLPCVEDHCGICGRNHVTEFNCPSCVGSTRADLADMATLSDALPEQAITWASAPIPGGQALVLSGPASTGISQAWAEECGEDTSHKVDEFGTPVPPLLLLATWREAWSDVLGIDVTTARATVDGEVRWLSEHLHEVAQHEAFVQFADEVRAARSELESLLLAGKRDAIGKVRCLDVECGALLRQTYDDPKPCRHDHEAKRRLAAVVSYGLPVWRSDVLAALAPCGRTGCDQGGRRDAWTCPACKREYDDDAYKLARKQANDERQPIRPGVQIARDLGIPAARVRQWITRKQVQRHGRDLRGRVLLDIREVRRRAMESGVAS